MSVFRDVLIFCFFLISLKNTYEFIFIYEGHISYLFDLYENIYIYISSNIFKLRKLSNCDSEDTPKVEIYLDLFHFYFIYIYVLRTYLQ